MWQFVNLALKPTSFAANKEISRLNLKELLHAGSGKSSKEATRNFAATMASSWGSVRKENAERMNKPLVEGATETALVEHAGNGLEEAEDLLVEARSDIEMSGGSCVRRWASIAIEALVEATASQQDQEMCGQSFANSYHRSQDRIGMRPRGAAAAKSCDALEGAFVSRMGLNAKGS